MLANVTEQLWIDFGLDTAVFLDTIAYWVKHNAANKQKHNFQQGQYWTYNTLEAYQKMFPGWSKQNIRRIIRNCIRNELLIISNFNKKGYDRTAWYSLTDKSLNYYPKLKEIIHQTPDNPIPDSCVGSNISCVGSNTPIPKLLPSSSNNTITTISESCDSLAAVTKKTNKKNEFLMELIAVYREVFPNNPQPHKRVISTSLQKTLQTLIKRWPELDPNGKSLNTEAFRRYLALLKESAPNFSLKEYITEAGNKKVNGLETFARWNTVVKFLENVYT